MMIVHHLPPGMFIFDVINTTCQVRMAVRQVHKTEFFTQQEPISLGAKRCDRLDEWRFGECRLKGQHGTAEITLLNTVDRMRQVKTIPRDTLRCPQLTGRYETMSANKKTARTAGPGHTSFARRPQSVSSI